MLSSITAISQQADYDSVFFLNNCVQLDARESIDEERSDLIYNWRFGDGTEGNGQIVEHCYDSVGVYQVVLSIIDSTVSSLFPNEWNFKLQVAADYHISFKINKEKNSISCFPTLTSNKNIEKAAFFWDFGDGEYKVGEEASHVYNKSGIYKIRLLTHIKNGDEIISLATTKTTKIN